ncbi:hypothetical protein GFL09_01300 [Pseudomonas stutzeri]|uniref:hypothetical protein n=1 Tax=Stutzerimonas stutzeri TaxID=316 RepID=UPI00190D3557|nr:hypothetical protein [Stutzerimonas stutzeri]MBK3866345.1 hypothetical protein [Stutzerimonas stutzeri]
MSIEDRDWYKEDFNRRMGGGKHQKQESPKVEQPQPKESAPKEKPKVERVKKYQGTAEERRRYDNVPPAHAILAAKYELAIRARTRKTFWAGVSLGALAASGATYLVMTLPSLT